MPQAVERGAFWLEQSSKQGNQFAQYTLGKAYLSGDTLQQNIPKAVQYLTQSAHQGNQFAQYTLGQAYLSGEPLQKDERRGLWYLEQSAAQGNPYAQSAIERHHSQPTVQYAACRMLGQLALRMTHQALQASLFSNAKEEAKGRRTEPRYIHHAHKNRRKFAAHNPNMEY